MAPSTPTETPDRTGRLVDQKALQKELGVSRWPIDERIRRYPEGHPNEFPVERIGRLRRFHIPTVRAWFAAERAGFPDRDNETRAA